MGLYLWMRYIMLPAKPRYSGPGRSGICTCGHPWDQHHLGLVVNQAYVDQTHEGYIPQECEAYGSNEMGGLNPDGTTHCHFYVDSLEGAE